VKINGEWRVYAIGAVLCVSLIICSENFGDRGGPHFMAALTLASVMYLLGVREFFATRGFPRRVVVFGLLLAAAWHIAFLRLPPGTDDDIHRYVWDGRLQRLGYSPYLVVPSDPVVRGLHTPETRNLNNPDLPSPYPPGAELFFRGVTAIRESTFAMKLAFFACELLVIVLLLDVLRWNNQGAQLVLAFAWNPLLAIEVAGSGHIDIVGALLVLLSAAALGRRRRTIAAITLGLAVAVKFLPIVLLPLYWKRVRIRDGVLAVLVVTFLYLPFLHHWGISTGSLGTYVQNFRFNGPLFALLNRFAPPELLAALAVLVGLGTAAWLRRTEPEQSPDAFAWPMAASLLFAPVVFPWYLLWLLPFLRSTSTLLILFWTASIIPTYVMWHFRILGRPWGTLPIWVMLVEYGCLGAVAAILLVRRMGRARTLPVPPAEAQRSS
jgi:alpha-1,6-mannosyltransferase